VALKTWGLSQEKRMIPYGHFNMASGNHLFMTLVKTLSLIVISGNALRRTCAKGKLQMVKKSCELFLAFSQLYLNLDATINNSVSIQRKISRYFF